MRPELKKRGLAVLIVCSLLLGAGISNSSEDFMKRLPLYDRFRCAICHGVSTPTTGNAPLNFFGTAFHQNGDKWDSSLADLDSDGDGFENGFELGDNEGDGIPDADNVRSNPGDPSETPSSLPPKTWGVIKKLFKE
ncbi:MAG: hypothetical protein KOO63_00330 [Bacteroidales bacterium]|nr:hypothetical protein [Candidatus Latescibacterota bacterium]